MGEIARYSFKNSAGRFEDFLKDESKLTATEINEIIFPKNSTELSEVLTDSYSKKELITISGGRTGVVGGAVPVNGGNLISTEMLKGIELISSDLVRVSSGVRLYELNEYLAEHNRNYFFPVDPTETWASFGGMVVNNSSGARSYKFGPTRTWVQQIEFVTPTGQIGFAERGNNTKFSIQNRELNYNLKIPKPLTKNAIGYTTDGDIIDLIVGSEGTLVTLSSITLRLAPLVDGLGGYLQFFKDNISALNFVEKIKASSLNFFAIEILDTRSIELLNNFRSDIKLGFQGAAIYLEGDNTSEWDLEKIIELVIEVEGDPDQSIGGFEESTYNFLRKIRHAVPETVNGIIAKRKNEFPLLHKISTDMAVPASNFKKIFAIYEDNLNLAGLEYVIFGHVGDSHLHVNIMPRNEEERLSALEIYKFFAKEAVKLGGAVSAEHGIGRLKKGLLEIQYIEEEIEKMRSIKSYFDPEWLQNRGVLIDRL